MAYNRGLITLINSVIFQFFLASKIVSTTINTYSQQSAILITGTVPDDRSIFIIPAIPSVRPDERTKVTIVEIILFFLVLFHFALIRYIITELSAPIVNIERKYGS